MGYTWVFRTTCRGVLKHSVAVDVRQRRFFFFFRVCACVCGSVRYCRLHRSVSDRRHAGSGGGGGGGRGVTELGLVDYSEEC